MKKTHKPHLLDKNSESGFFISNPQIRDEINGLGQQSWKLLYKEKYNPKYDMFLTCSALPSHKAGTSAQGTCVN